MSEEDTFKDILSTLDSTQGANSYASTTVRPNSGTAWYPSAPYPTTRGLTRVAFKYYERVRHFDRPDLVNTGNTRTSGWALITPERHSASLKLEITRHQRLRRKVSTAPTVTGRAPTTAT